MRVSRALDKLQVVLTKRGVALSTAALAGGLTTEAVTAAPAGLAATIAATTLAGSVIAGGAAATTIKLIAMTKIQAALFAALVLGTAAVPMLGIRTEIKHAFWRRTEHCVNKCNNSPHKMNSFRTRSIGRPELRRPKRLRNGNF